MKKIICVLLSIILTVLCTACGSAVPAMSELLDMEPELSQMKAICELSVMECYYHNVAKFKEEYTEKILGFIPSDKMKHFWIEYTGTVKLGIDASLVDIVVEDTEITITIPPAEVLGCNVDAESLTSESFIVAKDSEKIDAADETYAFGEAQNNMLKTAENDTVLLMEAQQRAMMLLENYIHNVGDMVRKTYTIKWIYIDKETVSAESEISDVE